MQDYRIGRLKGRYVVMWNDDAGNRRRFRLEAHKLDEAKSEARQVIIKETAPARGITVSQIWSAHREELGERRQAEKMRHMSETVLGSFGHLTPSQITIADCRAYIAARRAQGRKDGTIRTEMGALKSSLAWAKKARLISETPRMELPPVPQPRERYLSHYEVGRLLDAAGDPHIRLAMLLMVTTAGRSGALLELTWDRVDLSRRIIKLATNDIGPRKGRATVPINETLLAALIEAQAASLSRFVVEWAGGRIGSIKTGFNAAVRRAKLEHCTPHDLRRTAGRFMAEAGVPIEEIATYLGHTNPNVTRATYAKFSPDYLRHAAGSLELGTKRPVQRTRRHTLKSA
nr:site-specific integrase [Paracoccus marcusii]